MDVLLIAGLVLVAYFMGKSKGFEAGKKKAQQYIIEVKKKE